MCKIDRSGKGSSEATAGLSSHHLFARVHAAFVQVGSPPGRRAAKRESRPRKNRLLVARRTDAQPPRFGRNDSASHQRFAMTGQHEFARRGLPRDGTGNQPDDAAVRLTMDNREFPEILVECHQDSLFVPGPCQYRGVTWIGRPVANPDDVVAGVTECRGRFPPTGRCRGAAS